MTELAQLECWLSNQARKSILLESVRVEKGEEQDGENSSTSELQPIPPTSQDPLLLNKPTKGVKLIVKGRKRFIHFGHMEKRDKETQQLLQLCL